MPLFSYPPSLPSFKAQPKSTQALSRQMRLFVEQELHAPVHDTTCLLAVSGGADSLALLCLWLWLRPLWRHTVCVLHVNHGLRPESTDEATAVAGLCQAFGVECQIAVLDVAGHATALGLGQEEAARHCRYRALEEARQATKARWICTGHHAGDLEEDVLMRLMRGTGWPGLGGMVAVDEERHVLRPLLMLDPHALRKMLTAAGLGWAEDQSNADFHFLRNRVRHTLMPLIKAENPAFGERVRDLWHMARADAEHWDATLPALTLVGERAGKPEIVLAAAELHAADKATRLRLYARAVRHLARIDHGAAQSQGGQIRARTLLQVDVAWSEGRGGTLFQLPGGIRATLRRGAIIFYRD